MLEDKLKEENEEMRLTLNKKDQTVLHSIRHYHNR